MPTLNSELSARALVARNLKKIREEKEMSQFYLAKISNISQTYISQVESGNRNVSLDVLEKFAIALNVELVNFLEK